jgi:hypothetical protein
MLFFRIVLALLLFFVVGVTLWNVLGVVHLADIDKSYVGQFREGRLTDGSLSAEGVALVKEWVENRTRPAADPIVILKHQFWYNAVTEGYEMKLWMAPTEYSPTLREYAIYFSGDILFLRTEHFGRNRVLIASFSVGELERALEPFLSQFTAWLEHKEIPSLPQGFARQQLRRLAT